MVIFHSYVSSPVGSNYMEESGKWRYLQIIQNKTILVLKPMVLGIHHFKKPPYN